MSELGALIVPEGRLRSQAEAYEDDFLAARSHLVGICRSLIGDDAEDVVHDVYLRGRARLGQLRRPELLGAWLTRMAINECFARHRRRQRLAELLVRLLPPDATARDVDLRQLVEQLPYRDRCIVVLHYGHGLTINEIAELLSMKPATARSLLFRTRARLKEDLER